MPFTSFRTDAALLTYIRLFLFLIAVPMRECLGKHSCMSLPFPISILNGIPYFFAK